MDDQQRDGQQPEREQQAVVEAGRRHALAGRAGAGRQLLDDDAARALGKNEIMQGADVNLAVGFSLGGQLDGHDRHFSCLPRAACGVEQPEPAGQAGVDPEILHVPSPVAAPERGRSGAPRPSNRG